MAITKNAARQYPLVAYVDFTYADLTDVTAIPAIDLPAGATVIGGQINVTTAWDSATSDVVDVGDGVDPNRYTTGAALDLATLGSKPFDMTVASEAGPAYTYTAADTIDLTWNGTGAAPSAGAATLIIQYILDDRAHEVQPV